MFIWVLHKPEETETMFWKITSHQQQPIKIRCQFDYLREWWFPWQCSLELIPSIFPPALCKVQSKDGVRMHSPVFSAFQFFWLPPAYALNFQQSFCTQTETLHLPHRGPAMQVSAGTAHLAPSHLSAQVWTPGAVLRRGNQFGRQSCWQFQAAADHNANVKAVFLVIKSDFDC